MPRDIVTTVYKYDELSDKAKNKVVEQIREKLSGPWWDSFDNDAIGETMVYALARELHAPAWDAYGSGDFPGIDGVTIDAWSLDGGYSIAVSGNLTPENAPALPWPPGIDAVELQAKRDHTYFTLLESEPECICSDDTPLRLAPHISGCPSTLPNPATADQRENLERAARNAVRAAWDAGYAEMEYRTSDERAKDMIESNDWEFTEDGLLYS